jgi:hypothetical protein
MLMFTLRLFQDAEAHLVSSVFLFSITRALSLLNLLNLLTL